jgi:hypothetical protein
MRLAFLALCALATCSLAAQQSPADALIQAAKANSYPLAGTGRAFLLREAAEADFFLLGEIHGDNEVPELVATLWPAMWQQVRALLAGINRSHSVQPRKKHKLSAEARERIAAAQRKRWAKQKAARKR